MSTNCIRCISNKRTGPDLLCDECRGSALVTVEVGGLVGKLMKLRGWTREEAEARVLEALEENEE